MTDAADWTARVGRVWADEWRRTERAFAGVAAVLDAAITAAAPTHGVAVDIGCGVGGTTRALAAARPALTVTGIDLSPALIEVARAHTAADGPTFVSGDALAVLPTLAPCDLLVSRHGMMFFDDPRAAFANIRMAARDTAPLIFSCFHARADNDWATAIDTTLGLKPAVGGYAPGPFSLADRAFTTDLLGRAGWDDVTAQAHDVAYVVGAGDDPVADALGFFRRIGPAASILAAAQPDERARIEERLAAMLAPRIHQGQITFTAAIWIWSARAGKASA